MIARQLVAVAAALTLSACSTLGDPLFVANDGPTPDAMVGPDAPPPIDAMPLGPTFESIRQNILYPQCGVICHNTADPSGQLNMESGDVHARLVGAMAEGSSCGGMSRIRVVEGDPSTSLLYLKLASKRDLVPIPCGIAMPGSVDIPAITMTELDMIEMWITLGAPND